MALPPLSEPHLAQLRASAISDEIIEERGYRTETSAHILHQLESRLSTRQRRVPGLIIPIYRLGRPEPHVYLLRPDHPRNASKGKPIKYEWPQGAAGCFDVLPSRRADLGNPKVELWITEGNKKADALASAGYLSISLNGVYGWRGKNKDGGKSALSDFEDVAWNGRRVVLAFDSDVIRKQQVQAALHRLARLVMGRGASVYALHLPEVEEGKTGVDDFLASLPEGERRRVLEAHVEPEATSFAAAVEIIGKHPVTGKPLSNPPGYLDEHGSLTYTNPLTGRTKHVYSGLLAVTARGRDVDSGEQHMLVAFSTPSGKVTVTAPRSALSTARGIIQTLAPQGAAVHDSNARDVARFLIEFATHNADALPELLTSDRLGNIGKSIVGPDWSVGEPAAYTGPLRLETRSDHAAYRDALEAALAWDGWVLPFVMGLSAISPHLRAVSPRRNPVVWLHGNSNTGKSTALQFAVGLYGNPERKPLASQAGRSSWAGFQQEMTALGGLPLLIDEAHTADPKILQNVLYQFANKQAYTKGGKDGHVRGGEELTGVAFMAGEVPPEFLHQGSRNRALLIDAGINPPLGSLAAPERATLLTEAVNSGAGAWGEAITRLIWDNHDQLLKDLRDEERAQYPVDEGREWLRAILAAKYGLALTLQAMELPAEMMPGALVEHALASLTDGRAASDPVRDAFEAVRALVNTAHRGDPDDGGRYRYGELFATVDPQTGAAHVVTGSRTVKETLADHGGLRGLASQWALRGYVEADRRGNPTLLRRIAGARHRCLVIPKGILLEGVGE